MSKNRPITMVSGLEKNGAFLKMAGTVKVVRGTPSEGDKVVYVTQKWIDEIEASVKKAGKAVEQVLKKPSKL